MKDFSDKYLAILTGRLSGLNLTRILDPEEFYQKQVMDSILPYEQNENFRSALDEYKLLVDIGFGGGLPLLPLARHCQGLRAIGFETRGKKAEAVQSIAKELGLDLVQTHHLRVEQVLMDRPCVITLKAVGTVCDFLPLINVAHPDILVAFYKGPSFAEKELPVWERMNLPWELIGNQLLAVPGTDERRLVLFRPKNVPRGTAKELVKLSQFF